MKWVVAVVLLVLMVVLALASFAFWQGNTKTWRLAAVTAFFWSCAFNAMAQWAWNQP